MRTHCGLPVTWPAARVRHTPRTPRDGDQQSVKLAHVKYRHTFHAGNFADVHKHVTLLALLAALRRKDKGFLYFETHSGRGAYEKSNTEAESGVARIVT